jgi:hypothetical protein
MVSMEVSGTSGALAETNFKGRVFRLVNLVSELCLEVRGVGGESAGASVEVYPRDEVVRNDRVKGDLWTIKRAGTGYWIQNVASRLCLGVRGVDTVDWGADAAVFTCEPTPGDGRNDNRWSIRSPWKTNVVQVMNLGNEFRLDRPRACLAVRGIDGHRPGEAVEVNECGATPTSPLRDSYWYLVEVAHGADLARPEELISTAE